MSMRSIPDALNFTGIQTTSHITSVCCKVFMNILRFLSELFSNVVSRFAAMEFWTGCLLPGFIKPSVDHYICRNESGAASRSQLPSNHGAAKWHKTVRCCLQSYELAHVMWKAETAHVPVRGQLQMSGYRGFGEDASLLLHQRVRD